VRRAWAGGKGVGGKCVLKCFGLWGDGVGSCNISASNSYLVYSLLRAIRMVYFHVFLLLTTSSEALLVGIVFAYCLGGDLAFDILFNGLGWIVQTAFCTLVWILDCRFVKWATGGRGFAEWCWAARWLDESLGDE
jgi:hypothetical protein